MNFPKRVAPFKRPTLTTLAAALGLALLSNGAHAEGKIS
jgi:NitT/TauT family transport system substrate-binding protein